MEMAGMCKGHLVQPPPSDHTNSQPRVGVYIKILIISDFRSDVLEYLMPKNKPRTRRKSVKILISSGNENEK